MVKRKTLKSVLPPYHSQPSKFLRYVELDGEFIETPFHHFEEVPQTVAVTKDVSQVPKIARPPLKISHTNLTSLVWVSLQVPRRLYATLMPEDHP